MYISLQCLSLVFSLCIDNWNVIHEVLKGKISRRLLKMFIFYLFWLIALFHLNLIICRDLRLNTWFFDSFSFELTNRGGDGYKPPQLAVQQSYLPLTFNITPSHTYFKMFTWSSPIPSIDRPPASFIYHPEKINTVRSFRLRADMC